MEYVSPPPNDPGSQIAFISGGHYQKPAMAKILTRLSAFWLDHWKWMIGILAATGLALLKR